MITLLAANSSLYLFFGAICLLMMVYLFAALLKPEWFG